MCLFVFYCEFMFLGSLSVEILSDFGFKTFSSRTLVASAQCQGVLLIHDHFKLLAKASGELQKQVI